MASDGEFWRRLSGSDRDGLSAGAGADLHRAPVHLIRHSLTYASWKERKAIAAALKTIYQSDTADAAYAAAFAD